MLNAFSNDSAYVALAWLFEHIRRRNLTVANVYLVTHKGGGSSHYIIVFDTGLFVCDCAMPMNSGIPCRHFYAVWTCISAVIFHLFLFRRRYGLTASFIDRRELTLTAVGFFGTPSTFPLYLTTSSTTPGSVVLCIRQLWDQTTCSTIPVIPQHLYAQFLPVKSTMKSLPSSSQCCSTFSRGLNSKMRSKV